MGGTPHVQSKQHIFLHLTVLFCYMNQTIVQSDNGGMTARRLRSSNSPTNSLIPLPPPPFPSSFAVMVDEEKTIEEQGKMVGHTVGGVDSTCYTSGSAKISWGVSMLLVTLVAVAASL